MGDTSASTTLETTLAGTEGWTQGCLSSSFTTALWFATHGGNCRHYSCPHLRGLTHRDATQLTQLTLGSLTHCWLWPHFCYNHCAWWMDIEQMVWYFVSLSTKTLPNTNSLQHFAHKKIGRGSWFVNTTWKTPKSQNVTKTKLKKSNKKGKV